MLQFNGGQAATTDAFPGWPSLGGPQVVPVSPVPAILGPSQLGRGVLLSTYNNLADLQLVYRDKQSPGWGWRAGDVIQGLYPGSFVFPEAIGFRLKSHSPGVPAQVIAQVWEIDDGPLPQAPLSSNSATLSPGGTIGPGAAGMNLISIQSISGVSPIFLFGSIPQSYTHLFFVGHLQSFVGGAPATITCQINGINTASYWWIGEELFSTGPVTNNGAGATSWRVGESPTNSLANAYGSFQMWIPFYSDALNPSFMSESASFDGVVNSIRSKYGGSIQDSGGNTVGPVKNVIFNCTSPWQNNSKMALFGVA